MTKEEAIQWLETIDALGIDDGAGSIVIALKMATDALKAQQEVIHCKDCRWWEKKEYGSYGYCHAIKHSHYSRHWEINIRRTYEEDFYCADAELRTEEEEEEDD